MRLLVVGQVRWFLLLVTFTFVSSCTLTQRGREAAEVVAAFSQAECVVPSEGLSPDRNVHLRWDQTLDLGADLKIRIEAYGFIHGRVTVRYSDETSDRVVANPGLYVYPDKVRVRSDRQRLYAVANGLAGGFWHRTILYEYNLLTREILRELQVDGDDLPPKCHTRVLAR